MWIKSGTVLSCGKDAYTKVSNGYAYNTILQYLPKFVCCRIYRNLHLKWHSSSIIYLGQECPKTTGMVPCYNILLNSVHLIYTWYFSFHPILTCFSFILCLSVYPIFPSLPLKVSQDQNSSVSHPIPQEEDFSMCPVQ